MFKTLAIGAVGGVVFSYFNLPLAWMLGAMITTTVASLHGSNLRVAQLLRSVMVAIIGVMVGAAFTPEVLGAAARWLPTLSCLVVYLLAATTVLYVYFTRVLQLDPVTAYFSATPGGLTEMTLTGAAMGGDDRTIALMHACRILLVVLLIPVWFRYTTGIVTSTSGAPSLQSVGLGDAGILILCAVLGVLGGRALRLPAYQLVGPMTASAAVHAAGLTTSAPPHELVAAAQVVIGSAVGARFAGVPVDRVLRTLGACVLSTALLIGIALAFVLVLSRTTGIDWHPLVLAYAPGGLAEMTLIALALGIETAFVATHQVVRIVLILIGAPLLFRVTSLSTKRK